MKKTAAITTLRSLIVDDARKRLNGDAIERSISAALNDLSLDVPRYRHGNLTLSAEQGCYALPDDLVGFGSTEWGMERQAYLHQNGILKRPRISLVIEDGEAHLTFAPRVTAMMLSRFGERFEYRYMAKHELSEERCTVTDESLFYTRAQAELMRELMSMNVVEPIQAMKGMSDTELTGTPQYIYSQLMKDYRFRADQRT